MGRTNFESKVVIAALAQAIRQAAGRIADIYNFFVNWRVNRLSSKKASKMEIRATVFAERLDGKSPSEYAQADHTHSEYYRKDETVETARGIYRDGRIIYTEELAPANHEHPEYAKRGEFKVAAETLDGLRAEDFALKDHEHDEYIRIDEIVDAAEIIGGFRYSDFAVEGHTHLDEYYSKLETVDDAMFLVDPQRPDVLYSADDFAPVDHTHDEYFTLEDFMKLFLLKSEPYWVSDTFQIRVVDVVATDRISLNEGQTIYELLQSPYSQAPMRPAASVEAVTSNVQTKQARVIFVRNIGVAVGRYITLNIQVPGSSSVDILGVFPAVRSTSATSSVPVQVPVMGAFQGSTVVIYAPPFRSASVGLAQSEMGAGSVLVDLMILAECNLSTVQRTIGVVRS